MKLVKIEAFENGAHQNQTINGELNNIPDGWAVIPDDMLIPDTFPFVYIEVSDGIVTSMTTGIVPAPEDITETPTQLDKIEAQVLYTALMTDTLLESEG